MDELAELRATVSAQGDQLADLQSSYNVMRAQLADLVARLPAPPRVMPPAEPEGVRVTTFNAIPKTLPQAELDAAFGKAVATAAGTWVTKTGRSDSAWHQDMKRDFEVSLAYLSTLARCEIDPKRDAKVDQLARDFAISGEGWMIANRITDGASINAPSIMLAAIAAGIPYVIGTSVWDSRIGCSAKYRSPEQIRRTA